MVIEFEDSGESRPLQRDQLETLFRRIAEDAGRFKLDRLPPDADPYPTVLTLHPRFEINEDDGVIVERDGPTTMQLLGDDHAPDEEVEERTEPDLDVYVDALLLVDAVERHDVTQNKYVGEPLHVALGRPVQR